MDWRAPQSHGRAGALLAARRRRLALDAPGQPFHDPEADAALFRALEQTVRQTTNRQLIRIKRHINDPEFSSAVVTAFRALHGRAGNRKRAAR